MMTRFAREYKVLFINSLGMRRPSLKTDRHAFIKILRKLKSILRYLRKSDNGMYVLSPVSLPFPGNWLARAINTIAVLLQLKPVMFFLGLKKPFFYVNCPPAWELVKRLRWSYLIYERTDLFSEMSGVDKPYIASLDDALTRTADLVLYVNSALWREGRKKNTNSLLLGHGVDFERFACAEESNHIPEDIVAIPKPIIGFFGDITEEACDFTLLEHIAKNLSNMSLVLVGPISSDVSNLRAYGNIFFLGQKPYEQIPHYGKAFDVSIMPWKKNKWIEFCSPVKTKEYLALGKPVVSVDYPELKPYHDIVYAASDYDEFTDSIRRAARECDPHLKQRRQDRVRNETWDNKVKQIIEYIQKDLYCKNRK